MSHPSQLRCACGSQPNLCGSWRGAKLHHRPWHCGRLVCWTTRRSGRGLRQARSLGLPLWSRSSRLGFPVYLKLKRYRYPKNGGISFSSPMWSQCHICQLQCDIVTFSFPKESSNVGNLKCWFSWNFFKYALHHWSPFSASWWFCHQSHIAIKYPCHLILLLSTTLCDSFGGNGTIKCDAVPHQTAKSVLLPCG